MSKTWPPRIVRPFEEPEPAEPASPAPAPAGSAKARLRELGIRLPPLLPTSGNYVHAVRTGRLLFLAGKGIGPFVGKVGRDVSIVQAYNCARSAGLMLLSAMVHELGSLDQVARVVKVFGAVNAGPDFTDHQTVINGCSDLFVEVFGERGRHARTAIGAMSTVGQVPVEIEAIIECFDDDGA